MEEALIALDAGADIIDLKDPERGALGAVEPDVIRAVVASVGGRRTVSATAGDLPMEPALIEREVERIGALGVDVVKVGLFDGGDLERVLDALGRCRRARAADRRGATSRIDCRRSSGSERKCPSPAPASPESCSTRPTKGAARCAITSTTGTSRPSFDARVRPGS